MSTTIEFYKLPRAVQDGLLDAFRARFTPAPILLRRETRPTAYVWLAGSAASALALALLAASGFGKVDSALALQPLALLVAYLGLGAFVALGILRAVSYWTRLRALPFRPGIFLFPANVIDARDARFRVHPLSQLTDVGAEGDRVVLRFGAKRFVFELPDRARADDVLKAIGEARDRMLAGPPESERWRFDPLQPPTVESPLSTRVPIDRRPPTWDRYAFVVAAGVGTALGAGLFALRNAKSDDRMFAIARAYDEVDAYKRYAARGRSHRDEVTSVHLPRAELRLAVARGSVEAIDEFVRAYPTTGIQGEIDAARQAALHAEFDRARAVGTLAALLAFAEKHPKHGLDAPFAEARHAIYEKALAKFKKRLPTAAEKGVDAAPDFAKRLVAWAEKTGPVATSDGLRGPAVAIRFQRVPSKDLERADDIVRKNPMFGGTPSLPTQYLDAAHLEPHERRTAQEIADAFAGAFDPEILTFEPGALFEGDEEKMLAEPRPTLYVSYRLESSGAAYASKKPRGIYMGLLFFSEARFVLPKDPGVVRLKHTLAQRIPLDLLQNKPAAPEPGTLETVVYDTMLRSGFAALRDRFVRRWLKKDG